MFTSNLLLLIIHCETDLFQRLSQVKHIKQKRKDEKHMVFIHSVCSCYINNFVFYHYYHYIRDMC